MMNTLLIVFAGLNKGWIDFYSYSISGFTPNRGQVATDSQKEAKEVIFYTRSKNLTMYITERGISYVIHKGDNFSRVDYELIGAKIERSKVEYYDELQGYENYYLSHCPEGVLFTKSYRKVVIKDIYHDINWIFRYDDFGKLHHEFEIKKGGEVANIKIRIKNAKLKIRDKEIEMITPIGSIMDGKLVAYENEEKVEVSYKLKEDLVGFALNGYDGSGNLIIDPELVWATYYGGSGDDSSSYISIDKNNNVYIAGATTLTNFPTYNPGGNSYYQEKNAGFNDAFIVKFSSNGVRLWATYYGGNVRDFASSISIDNDNNVYVVGYTYSTRFPIYKPQEGAYFQQKKGDYNYTDAFILKFNSQGLRLWATYYGGSNFDYATSISIDKNNNLYVVGYTQSTDFPVYNPGGNAYFQEGKFSPYHSDAFILKFNSKGERLWATRYGGEYSDEATSISIDNDNNVYVVGYALGSDFPTYNPGGNAYLKEKESHIINDIFILKFNSNGVRLWATYFGGSREDKPQSISIDKDNNIYIVGYTDSYDFPIHNPGGGAYSQGKVNDGHYDAFIVKFNSDGQKVWSTCYGGYSADYATSVSIDNNNDVYVVGYTHSENFPVYNGGGVYFQASKSYGDDAFILKFNSSGVRLWATYYGGSSDDKATSISIDNNNNLYIVGNTESYDFPKRNPGGGVYFEENSSGSYSNFILKFKIK